MIKNVKKSAAVALAADSPTRRRSGSKEGHGAAPPVKSLPPVAPTAASKVVMTQAYC